MKICSLLLAILIASSGLSSCSKNSMSLNRTSKSLEEIKGSIDRDIILREELGRIYSREDNSKKFQDYVPEDEKAEKKSFPVSNDNGKVKSGDRDKEEEKEKIKLRITLRGFDIPLGQVLLRIIKPTDMNLILEKEVEGNRSISIDLNNLSIEDALKSVLSPLGYFYKIQGQEVTIFALETKTWILSPPPVVYSYENTISNESVTKGESAGEQNQANMGTVRLGAKVTVTTKEEKLSFWNELEDSLKKMVSPKGYYSINKIAGLLTARDNPEQLHQIDEFIKGLEREVAKQALVEVKVIEVTLSTERSYGINWQKVWFDLLKSGAHVITSAGFAEKVSSPFSIGVARGVDEVFIKALETQGNIKIVSQPRIFISNNRSAVLQVGQIQSYISEVSKSVSTSGGSESYSVKTSAVQDGLIFYITPRILDSEIMLNLTPVLTRVNEIRQIQFGSTIVETPNVNSRSMSTTVKLKDGESVILGGLISEKNNRKIQGIPFLSKIPLIGALFGSYERMNEKTEIIIMITPTIIKSHG